MNISLRLKKIISLIEKCESLADIGTDHGYIPIEVVKSNICKKAIASDISKGSLKKAKDNTVFYGLQDQIQCKLGGGLEVLKPREVEEVVIAGMGGNLIVDILEEGKEVVDKLKYIILQPAQNPEVLRKYLYNNNFEILKEDLCIDNGRFYEIIKVRRGKGSIKFNDEFYYELSPVLLKDKNPLIKEFIDYKIDKYSKILEYVKEQDTLETTNRKKELEDKITRLKEIRLCI